VVIVREAELRGVQWVARPLNVNCMVVSRVLTPYVSRRATLRHKVDRTGKK